MEIVDIDVKESWGVMEDYFEEFLDIFLLTVETS
jgi:hypothetical protein